MLIDNKEFYDKVWDRVYKELGFHQPGSEPFQISGVYAVYKLGEPKDHDLDYMNETIRSIFVQMTDSGERLYALDWQHDGFLFDPRNLEEQKDLWIPDKQRPSDVYPAYFPAFYPDGDYHFFIDEQFRFGYLGHPWRREVWIFGDALVQKFEEVYDKLGWVKVK